MVVRRNGESCLLNRGISAFALLAMSILLSGCLPSLDGGPKRMFTVAEETTALKDQVITLQSRYYADSGAATVAARNEIIAERIAAIDANYYVYEAALTREHQEFGFLSSLANIGLTTTATVIPVAQTKTLLTGISTGIQGGSKAYSDEILYQKTVQVLQSQMRANRAGVAAQIITRMKLSLSDYPLAMAMSNLEEYYAAGTLSAGLIQAANTVGREADLQEENKADAIVRTKFTSDDNTKLLESYLFPSGPDGNRDEGRAARLVEYLNFRGFKGTLTEAVWGDGNAKVRAQLVKDAKLKK